MLQIFFLEVPYPCLNVSKFSVYDWESQATYDSEPREDKYLLQKSKCTVSGFSLPFERVTVGSRAWLANQVNICRPFQKTSEQTWA